MLQLIQLSFFAISVRFAIIVLVLLTRSSVEAQVVTLSLQEEAAKNDQSIADSSSNYYGAIRDMSLFTGTNSRATATQKKTRGMSGGGRRETELTPYEVLSLFYHATNGPDWLIGKEGWLDGDDPCTSSWSGVICTSTGEVEYLGQASKGLDGTLPSELGLLSQTTFFWLYSNSLSGSIPSQLGLLTNMKQGFGLYVNSFTGSIPSQLGMMSLLTKDFILTSNGFSGSIPSQLGLLTKVSSYFELSYNNLCGSLPTQVSNLNSANGGNVVSVYGVESGNMLGTLCCIANPVENVTCAPSFSPTISLSPTTRTNEPSSLPTRQPTLHPTYFPTLIPSPLPTLAPTQRCPPGTYFNEVECTNCPIGHYSNFSAKPPFPTNCSLCPSGQYNTQVAMTECIDCAAGKVSSVDRTFCQDCKAGEYSLNGACHGCEEGKYAPNALVGQCLECSPGFYTDNITYATSCTSCDAGKYSSNTTRTKCLSCPPGYRSGSSAASCEACRVGEIAGSWGVTTCTACDAGTYAAITASTNCTVCGRGTYQGATGQGSCNDCEVGKYSNELRTTSCINCDTGLSSKTKAVSCSYATEKYYLHVLSPLTSAFTCPNNARCYGDRYSPIPDSGYWVDRSKFKFMGDMYKCSRSTCKGGGSVSNNVTASCWTVDYFNSTQSSTSDNNGGVVSCKSDNLQCREGSKGPFCGACDGGFVYRGASNVCEPCEGAQLQSILITFALLLLALAIFFHYRRNNKNHSLKKDSEKETRIDDSDNDSSWSITKVLACADSGSLKVMWVTYQIIVSASFTLEVSFPAPFDGMLGTLSIFSFDFLALECASSGDNAYFTTVYLWCCIPILVSIGIISFGAYRAFLENPDILFDERKEVINQHFWLLLFFSYLVLPAVSSKQLQSLDCISLKSNESYLRSDTSIDCQSESYLNFRAAVFFFIALYQIIPIVWMFLLYQKRELLNPSISNNDKNLAMFVRDSNAELAPLKFLFYDYKCSKWWFEIAELYRRIIFIGIVPLVSPNSATRSSFGCIFAIISISYFREEQPYRTEFTNVIAHVAQFAILLTFYSALTINTDSMMNFGLEGTKLGVFLVLTNLVIFILSLWFAWRNFKKQLKKRTMQAFKASLNEDARGFSESKFKTTFDSIWHNSVPSSHALVFYYTSYQQAQTCRKSGIPLHGEFKGVPLTLRHPYAVKDNDFQVFGQNHQSFNVGGGGGGGESGGGGGESETRRKFPHEEVLLLLLPKEFLEVLPGYEHDEALCMISADLIHATRPTSFSSIVNFKPWLEDFALLSPYCIMRSFWIMDKLTSSNLDGNSLDVQNQSTNKNFDDDIIKNIPSVKETKDSTVSVRSFSSLRRNLSSRTSMLNSRLSARSSVTNDVSFVFSQAHHLKDLKLTRDVKLVTLDSLSSYINAMQQIRQVAFKHNLVALYHYTSPFVAPLILKSGLRMSTQGQGDGGVYVSTLGPASYGLGSDDYEVNIIKDCFGVERIDEYIGKGKLDVVLVYGCLPSALHQAPGGRVNAKMISRSTFGTFSLEHSDGNYFLRPDRILGAFLIQSNREFMINTEVINAIEIEKAREHKAIELLETAQSNHKVNVARIDVGIQNVWGSSGEMTRNKLETRMRRQSTIASSNPLAFDDLYPSSATLDRGNGGGSERGGQSFNREGLELMSVGSYTGITSLTSASSGASSSAEKRGSTEAALTAPNPMSRIAGRMSGTINEVAGSQSINNIV